MNSYKIELICDQLEKKMFYMLENIDRQHKLHEQGIYFETSGCEFILSPNSAKINDKDWIRISEELEKADDFLKEINDLYPSYEYGKTIFMYETKEGILENISDDEKTYFNDAFKLLGWIDEKNKKNEELKELLDKMIKLQNLMQSQILNLQVQLKRQVEFNKDICDIIESMPNSESMKLEELKNNI